MSTAEKYVHSLRQIKEAEDNIQLQVEEHKRRVSEEFRNFESYVTKTIAENRTSGEKLVESSTEQLRKKASAETQNIISEAEAKSKTVSARVDAQTVREIIDNLLKEV